MKTKTLFWIATYAIVGYGAYYLLTKHKRDIQLINEKGLRTPNEAFLKSADKGYISAWAKAIRQNRAEFFFNGATYLTNGGRVKK